MQPREAALTVWSLVMLGLVDLEACMYIYRVLSNVDIKQYSPRDLVRLQLAQYILEAQGRIQQRAGAGVPGIILLPPRVVQHTAAAWQSSTDRHQPSRMCLDIADCLRGMGLDPALSVPSEDEVLMIDLAVPLPGQRRLAVLDIKPHETSANEPYRVTGYVAGVRRMLEARGWEVVGVAWHEWQGCKDRRELLRKKLGVHLQLGV